MDRTIEVDNSPMLVGETLTNGQQQLRGVSTMPFVAGVREPHSNIALPGCSKQSVNDGMKKDIGVAVTVEPECGGADVDSPDDQPSADDRAMSVVSFPDSQIEWLHPDGSLLQVRDRTWSCGRICQSLRLKKGASAIQPAPSAFSLVAFQVCR